MKYSWPCDDCAVDRYFTFGRKILWFTFEAGRKIHSATGVGKRDKLSEIRPKPADFHLLN